MLSQETFDVLERLIEAAETVEACADQTVHLAAFVDRADLNEAADAVIAALAVFLPMLSGALLERLKEG